MNRLNIITNTINALKELYPEWKTTDATVNVWMIGLAGLTDIEIEGALVAYIQGFDSQYAKKHPAPSDFLKQLHKRIKDSTESSWSQAFSECIEKSAKVLLPVHGTLPDGSFGPLPVKFSSPLVERAFDRFGGARAFASIEDGDTTAAAQFRDIYHATRDKMLARKESIAELPKEPVRLALPAPSDKKPLTQSQEEKAEKIRSWVMDRFGSPDEAVRGVARMLAKREFLNGGENNA